MGLKKAKKRVWKGIVWVFPCFGKKPEEFEDAYVAADPATHDVSDVCPTAPIDSTKVLGEFVPPVEPQQEVDRRSDPDDRSSPENIATSVENICEDEDTVIDYEKFVSDLCSDFEEEIDRIVPVEEVPVPDIRFYGDKAVIFLNDNEPHFLYYESCERRVLLGPSLTVDCCLGNSDDNNDDVDFLFGGKIHTMRIGFPTRELYIDDCHYHCLFGGPPINVEIGGRVVQVALEGPEPEIEIGTHILTHYELDFLAGFVTPVVHCHARYPTFPSGELNQAEDEIFSYIRPSQEGDTHKIDAFLSQVEYYNCLISREDVRYHKYPIQMQSFYLQFRLDLITSLRMMKNESNDDFELETTTIHLAARLLDIYMDLNNEISLRDLMLIAMTCLRIAAKFGDLDSRVPEPSQLQYLSEDSYTVREFHKMEENVLHFFSFDLNFSTALDFLLNHYFASDYILEKCTTGLQQDQENLNNFKDRCLVLAELALNEIEFIQIKPSVVAASCIAATRFMFKLLPTWPQSMVTLSGYSLADIDDCVAVMKLMEEE